MRSVVDRNVVMRSMTVYLIIGMLQDTKLMQIPFALYMASVSPGFLKYAI